MKETLELIALLADWSEATEEKATWEGGAFCGSPAASPTTSTSGPLFPPLQASCPSWHEVKLANLRSLTGQDKDPLQAEALAQELPLTCAKCRRCFTEPGALEAHQALHRDGKAPFVCSSCGKVFQYRLNLLTHKKHRGKQPYHCAQCGHQFCIKGDLLRHRASHSAEGLSPRCKRPLFALRVEHMGKGASLSPGERTASDSEAELPQNDVADQEEKPFVCAECGKSFIWKESLHIHQRTHAQDGGHSCLTCGRTFSRHGNLLTHQRLHMGDLPFVCPVCGRRFPSRTYLVAHSRWHQEAKQAGLRFHLPEDQGSPSMEEQVEEKKLGQEEGET